MKISAYTALGENRIQMSVEREVRAGSDRELVGTLYVTEEGLSWRPKNAKIPIDTSWDEFTDWMTGG